MLSDPDPDVRLLVCEIARGLETAQANRLLCDLLDREGEVNVCAAAVEVLTEAGGPESVPVLQACAARFRHEPFLGFAIRVALDRIGAHARPPRG